MYVEDKQLAAFAPFLDGRFRARCIEALGKRGRWSEDRLERAVDTALQRARDLGFAEERSILAYILLASDVVVAKPDEHVLRAVEAILKEPGLPEWQRVCLAEDYFRQ